ncbi:hypothetical protein B0H14DRAFT_3421598 [Mycena olivaceomarginata]|nr:hypothetical protein B0H14DRAFT_3421598 [Mycena olivaceomarginata]
MPCTNSIVLQRVEVDLSLGETRCRLHEKILSQESGRRTRSNSLSSTSAFSDAALEKIASEEDWARLRASLDRANLTLRVVNVSS